MAQLSRLTALAAFFLLATSGGSALAQTSVDVLDGAGGFDTDDWHFQGPDVAAFAREACAGFTGSCARISGADLGARTYDAQLAYWDGEEVMPHYVSLQGGKQYRIRLNASSSAAGKTIEVALEDTLYRVVLASTFTVGTTPAVQTGDAVVIPVSAGSRDVSLRVNVGGAANAGVTFSIDDLAILEEDGPPPGESQDLLADGDFESNPSTASWNRWGNATFSIADCSADGFTGMCFRAVSSDFGPNPWSTQLVKWNGASAAALYALDPAKQYEVKLRARATAPDGVLQLMLQQAGDPPADFTHDFALTATATDYSFAFQVPEAVSLAFKLDFISPAGTAQTIEVDDIQLLESDPPAP